MFFYPYPEVVELCLPYDLYSFPTVCSSVSHLVLYDKVLQNIIRNIKYKLDAANVMFYSGFHPFQPIR